MRGLVARRVFAAATMSSRHKAAGTSAVLSAARDKCTDRHARLGLNKVWDATGKVVAARLKAGKVGRGYTQRACRGCAWLAEPRRA